MPNPLAQLNHRKLLPPLVLAALLLLAALALFNPPGVDRAPPERGALLTVETQTLRPRSYQVVAPSYGTVQPRTQSNLVAQVAGEVTWVNPQFRDGGVFRAEDRLLRIDPRDYEADVQIARATLLDARQALAEERAQSEQARADWERLGDGGEPSDLVLRKPQMMAAEARVASAEAGLRKAEIALERTSVTAPFDGRILSTEVDLGEVVGNGGALAEIYATDYVEIRLPVANSDLDYVDLPEPRPEAPDGDERVPVAIHSSLSGGADWAGFLVRTEGAIDDSSRQLHAVAQVDDPFLLDPGTDASGRRPLKIGEYVTASIAGRTLAGAIVIPNRTIYQGSYVYVVKESLLERRDIDIAWQNDSEAVIAAGLEAGDALVTTTLGQVTSGTRVATAGESTRLVKRGADGPAPGAPARSGSEARP